MTITQLKCFQAVCKYNKFSIAAEQLFISQSSVSKHIIALENELGLELLVRKGKKIEITEEGNILLRYFSTILSTYDQAMQAAEELREKRKSEKTAVHIIGTPGMQRYGFLDQVKLFQEEYPEIKVSIEDMEGASALAMLEYEACDFAFLEHSELDRDIYDWIVIEEDRISVGLKAGSDLADHKELSVEELEGYSLIFPGRNTLMYDLCLKLCSLFQNNPDIIHTTSRPSMGVGYLTSEDKAAFFWPDRALRALSGDDFCVCRIRNPAIIRYVLAWRKDRRLTESQILFLRFLRKTMKIT